MAEKTMAEKIKAGREATIKEHNKKCEALKKLPEKVKARELHCKTIEAQITSLAANVKLLDELSLEIYQTVMDPDCLYYDSPISPSKTYRYIKEFMIKKDMDFMGILENGKESAKSFYVRAQEVSGWIMRFSKPKPLPKFGIEAFKENE